MVLSHGHGLARAAGHTPRIPCVCHYQLLAAHQRDHLRACTHMLGVDALCKGHHARAISLLNAVRPHHPSEPGFSQLPAGVIVLRNMHKAKAVLVAAVASHLSMDPVPCSYLDALGEEHQIEGVPFTMHVAVETHSCAPCRRAHVGMRSGSWFFAPRALACPQLPVHTIGCCTVKRCQTHTISPSEQAQCTLSGWPQLGRTCAVAMHPHYCCT